MTKKITQPTSLLDTRRTEAGHDAVSAMIRRAEERSACSLRSVLRGAVKIPARTPACGTAELAQNNHRLQPKGMSLEALLKRITELQDEERGRLEQDLAGVAPLELPAVITQMMEVMKCLRLQTTKEKTTDAAAVVRKVEDEIRILSYVLRPPRLVESGLRPALEWSVDEFTKRSGIQADLQCPPSLPRLKAEKEMALFRVAQEGLTNGMRHPGSGRVGVYLDFDANFVVLSVEDERPTVGRARLAKLAARVESGLGVVGMRQRLQQFGGGLEINGGKRATQLVAMMPVGEAPPIEEPPTEAEILSLAEALGYRSESKGGLAVNEQVGRGGCGTDPPVRQEEAPVDRHGPTK